VVPRLDAPQFSAGVDRLSGQVDGHRVARGRSGTDGGEHPPGDAGGLNDFHGRCRIDPESGALRTRYPASTFIGAFHERCQPPGSATYDATFRTYCPRHLSTRAVQGEQPHRRRDRCA
jgi:hypothetical protein